MNISDYKEQPSPETERLERLLNLLKRCSETEVFELGDTMYLGNRVEVIKSFIKNNPDPADFEVWVDKNYPRLVRAQ